MPGYRALPARLSGSAADHVRLAELHQQDGDLTSAAGMLELALEQATHDQGEMPAWICGRLAAAYRSLARYEEEVALLERYSDTQLSDDGSSRFRARLSKARAIAERRRKPDTGALQTVREVRTRSRNRRRGPTPVHSTVPSTTP
jgi:hypothetical protein